MAQAAIPAPPRGAGPSGRQLWQAVVNEFELSAAELVILKEYVRVVDRLDDLDALRTLIAAHFVTERPPVHIFSARNQPEQAGPRPGNQAGVKRSRSYL